MRLSLLYFDLNGKQVALFLLNQQRNKHICEGECGRSRVVWGEGMEIQWLFDQKRFFSSFSEYLSHLVNNNVQLIKEMSNF